MSKLLTIKEAVKEFGYPETFLRRLVRENGIPYIKSGTWVYIRRETLENLGLDNEKES